VVEQLDELDRLLRPYRSNRDVADLLGHLAEEMRERRWLCQWLPLAAATEHTGTGSRDL
jgi:hypothetical protein